MGGSGDLVDPLSLEFSQEIVCSPARINLYSNDGATRITLPGSLSIITDSIPCNGEILHFPRELLN